MLTSVLVFALRTFCLRARRQLERARIDEGKAECSEEYRATKPALNKEIEAVKQTGFDM